MCHRIRAVFLFGFAVGALDSRGKPLGSTFSVLRRYTRRPRLQPRIYSDLDAFGAMVLKDLDEGCSASLMFKFNVQKWPLIVDRSVRSNAPARRTRMGESRA